MQMPENDLALEESKTATKPTSAIPPRNADKRAAAILAKKKQRRAAHQVVLRRSHTKG